MYRIALALFLTTLATPAFADAIDGSWCNGTSGHISIDGPKITLSPTITIDGHYTRHEFLYTVPAGQDHAGDQIYMHIQDEEDMTSFTVKDGKGVDPVAWKRCAVTS